MKKNLFIFVFLAVFSLLHALPLEKVPDFGENPGKLRMFTYIPEMVNKKENVPLVLILHGSGQTAKVLAAASGFNKLADSLGFIALYPDQPFYNNLLTSFSFYMPGKMKKGRGETASIRNMITYMCEHYPVDRDRIYITGMSAGAAMSNVMLNAYPELFAAGALFAAPSNLYEEINPDRRHKPVIAVIHGDRDLTVLPKHADKVIIQWLDFFDLDPDDRKTSENYLGHSFLRLSSWPAEGEPQLLRLDLLKTGHILLVDIGNGIKQGGQYSLFTHDKDFHLPYWICEFFGLI